MNDIDDPFTLLQEQTATFDPLETESKAAGTSTGDAEASDVSLSASSVQLNFIDFGCDPIPNLKYRIRAVDGRFITDGVTDSKGLTNLIDGLEPGLSLQISVYRMFTKDYKHIGNMTLAPGMQLLTCVSPKIKVEAEMLPLQGEPGTAGSQTPPIPKTIEELNATAETAESSVTLEQQRSQFLTKYIVTRGDTFGAIAKRYGLSVVELQGMNPQIGDPNVLAIGWSLNVPEGTLSTTPKPTASETSKIRTAKTKARSVQYGRDTKGQPVATVYDETKDWLSRKILAVLNFWTHSDFVTGATNTATSGHLAINPPTIAPGGARPPSADTLKYLKALIEFEEKQVKVEYPKGTAQVMNAYAKGKTEGWGVKNPNKTLSACLQYVKVALAYAGYTNGTANTMNAKDSGKDWVAFGFRDVTNQIPSVDVFMVDGKKIAQPDLVYTLPGDVIVYEQYNDLSRAGHIDIRTYHGFGSDFFWGPARAGFPDQSKYRVTNIYRKFSDTKATARLQAFLRILREHETKGFADPYHALFDPSGKTKPTFNDETLHPFKNERKPAGAYQLKWDSFKEAVGRMHWGVPIDNPTVRFDAAMQDRVAIFRLQFRHAADVNAFPMRTALGYILQGDIDKAINDCKLYNEWACLPGGGQQALINMTDLKVLFDQYANDL